MKKLLLILVGCIPFLLGNIMEYLISTIYYDEALPYNLIAITYLIFWFIIAKLIYKFTKTSKYTTMIVHIPAFLVLGIILFQEWVLHGYYTNIIGISIQYFYLPFLSLPRLIPFSNYIFRYGIGLTCIFVFILMYGTFYLGCKPKKPQDIIPWDWGGV